MPQMGQLPGASRTISGCIGQVYFFVGLLAVAGSAVWQPVRTAKAAPGNSIIIVAFILFIIISFVLMVVRLRRHRDGNCFVHSFVFRSRKALAMTDTELKLMAAPA